MVRGRSCCNVSSPGRSYKLLSSLYAASRKSERAIMSCAPFSEIGVKPAPAYSKRPVQCLGPHRDDLCVRKRGDSREKGVGRTKVSVGVVFSPSALRFELQPTY